MGGGGLVQLVAIGAQDVYITGQPQITFFKSVYRRHTNFAIEPILQNINGSAQFGKKISVTIFKNGDLLKKLWIQYSPKEVLEGVTPSNPNYFVGANIGHAIIDYVELEIGGQIIDKHYGKWMTIWNYLTECDSAGIQGAIGTEWQEPSYADNAVYFSPDGDYATRYNIMAYTHRADFGDTPSVPPIYAPDQAYVPLRFWFCRNPGLAIPLLALQYTEIKLNITLGKVEGIYCLATPPSVPTSAPVPTGNEFDSLKVYADYIFLDSSERRQFTQNSHEYLIEQLQVLNNTTDTTINLTFNHPIKELVWSPSPKNTFYQPNTATFPTPDNGIYIPGLASPSTSLVQSDYLLLFNGIQRFNPRDYKYFTRNQVWDCHTGYGSILFPNSIAVYSFALRPEEQQPSGTCNFSRLDSAQIIRSTTDEIDIYATNYNVLRIMSGNGGLAYTN